jgi:hypothetical protein
MIKSGIYKIVNNTNGNFYIGSSVDIKFSTNEYSKSALAKEYGVGTTIIHHIVNRTKWTSVT